MVLVAVIVAGGAVAATFFWQDAKNDSTTAKLDEATNKVDQLETQLEEATQEEKQKTEEVTEAPQDQEPDLIPGGADTKRGDGRVLIKAVFKYSLEPSAVWVEYGQSPTELDNSTEKITRGLALGGANVKYAHGFSASIDDSDLEPGTVYYYRTAATVNGETQRSTVASFMSDK